MPRPRPPLDAELLARPQRTARWRVAGVTERELSGSLWARMHQGCHLWLPDDVTDPVVRIQAAISVMPTDAALGGWAALHWLGVKALDGRTGARAATLLPITLCIGPVGRMRPQGGLEIDRSTLLPIDLTEQQGVVVTSPERSCLDVMRRSGPEDGLVAADAAIRAGITSEPQLLTALGRLDGMRGVPSARLAVSLADGGAESGPESRLRYVWVVEAGLPRPLVNRTVVTCDGTFVARTDLLDPENGTVGEYDGAHHRELAQHTADNAREEDLEALNLEVTRATALDLWVHRPRLVQRLQAAHRRGRSRDRSRDAWGMGRP